MWIKAPDNWKRLAPVHDDAPDEFDEPIEFNENGSKNTSDTIGKYVVEKYDEITEYENETTEEN